jgi:hypothetical protein
MTPMSDDHCVCGHPADAHEPICEACDCEAFKTSNWRSRLTQLRDEMRKRSFTLRQSPKAREREAAGMFTDAQQNDAWADTLDEILSGTEAK